MTMFKECLIASLTDGNYNFCQFSKDFSDPDKPLLQVSSEYDESITQLVEGYQRERVEVFECLRRIAESDSFKDKFIFEDCKLVASGGGFPDENTLNFEDFFGKIHKYSVDLWKELGDDTLESSSKNNWSTVISRWANAYPSYQKPAQSSPKSAGTNLLYLLNCARKSAGGDERASHLFETQKRQRLLWRVLPGPLTIQLFVHLATRENSGKNRQTTIGDLFSHLAVYRLGTDTEAGRSAILDSLENLGLLRGSPDAGASLPIRDPFLDSDI